MQSGESTTLAAERARLRLEDWRARVHHLYDSIEQELRGTGFRTDRSGKHVGLEELAERAGVRVPELDILRIENEDGTNAAILSPKGLWVIGANGRVDLRLINQARSELYLLLDQSEPLAGKAQWIRAPVHAPFEREFFEPSWLRNKLLGSRPR